MKIPVLISHKSSPKNCVITADHSKLRRITADHGGLRPQTHANK